jgi:hypothetical protein
MLLFLDRLALDASRQDFGRGIDSFDLAVQESLKTFQTVCSFLLPSFFRALE